MDPAIKDILPVAAENPVLYALIAIVAMAFAFTYFMAKLHNDNKNKN